MGFTFDFNISDCSDADEEVLTERPKIDLLNSVESQECVLEASENVRKQCDFKATLPQATRIHVNREKIRNLYEWEVLNLQSSKMGGLRGKLYKRTIDDVKVQLALDD